MATNPKAIRVTSGTEMDRLVAAARQTTALERKEGGQRIGHEVSRCYRLAD